MPPSSTPTSAGRQTTLLGFFNKPTPGGSQSKPNIPNSTSRTAPKTPTLGASSKPVAGSKSKQSVSRTGSNSDVLQQQAQVQESPLGNKGKSRGLVRTPSDERNKKLGSAQSIRVEGEPIEIDLNTSMDLSMDLTMDTSMDVDVDLDRFDNDDDNGNHKKQEEEEDVFTATPRSKTSITAGSTKPASSTSLSISASTPKPKGFTPLVPQLKPKPTVVSGPSGISETSIGAGSSSPLSELEDLPETEISTSISKSVPEVSKTDDVDVMDEEEAEESPIKMTVSHIFPFRLV